MGSLCGGAAAVASSLEDEDTGEIHFGYWLQAARWQDVPMHRLSPVIGVFPIA
jgi:hypothetical protein